MTIFTTMCRLYITVSLFLILSAPSWARERAQGYCQQGGVTLTIQGMSGYQGTPKVAATYPGCTVNVYLAGTTTPATLYGDTNGTAKSNPFTADTTGAWYFYADNGHYDVAMSGGGLPAPVTQGDRMLSDLPGLPNAASVLNYKYNNTGTSRAIQNKLDEQVSVLDFGAKGDDTTDDTTAVQACINYSRTARVSCYLPTHIYKITGAGLTMGSASVLKGDTQFGDGNPVLKYYGTGTAISIGDGISVAYAPVLEFLTVLPAPGYTAQYGINVRSLSEGHWHGVNIGGGLQGSSGHFITELRFEGSGGLVIDGLAMGNTDGTGVNETTGILFDEGGGIGGLSASNSSLIIKHADLYMHKTVFDVRNCMGCIIEDALNIEAWDVLVRIDSSLMTQETPTHFNQNSLSITGSYFLSNFPNYFPNRQVAYVHAAADRGFLLYELLLQNNVIMMAAGTSNPVIVVNNEDPTFDLLNLAFEHNKALGVNSSFLSLAASSTTRPMFSFGWNHIKQADGQTNSTLISGSTNYTLNATTPTDASGRALTFQTLTGTRYMMGGSGFTQARPTAGADVAGAIYGADIASPTGNNDGFIRVGTKGGTLPGAYSTYCDWFGSNSDSTQNRSMACFVGNTEEFRMDGNQVKVSNVPLNAASITGSDLTLGGLAALRGYLYANPVLTFSAPATVPGCTDQSFTLTGARFGDSATVVGGTTLPANMQLTANVVGPDIVTVRWCQFSGTPTVPPSGINQNYSVRLFR